MYASPSPCRQVMQDCPVNKDMIIARLGMQAGLKGAFSDFLSVTCWDEGSWLELPDYSIVSASFPLLLVLLVSNPRNLRGESHCLKARGSN